MLFNEILGQDHIKNHLTRCADLNRIPHAQLFVGPEGCGKLAMAIAISQYILCKNSNGENISGNNSCNLKFNNFSHPDLHFVFPVASNDKIKSRPISSNFYEEWRFFLKENIYGGLFDWYQLINIQNKQGQIGVDEASEINKTLALKSYEGGYKIMIIWMADKMNNAASNKLLKLIEEPPEKTLFFLITETIDDIIQTIRSRCQIIDFIGISEKNIAESLIKNYNCDEKIALQIAHKSEGNFNKALHFLKKDKDEFPFEEWFVLWVRSAFKAKGNAAVIHELIQWSENIASLGREIQKQFIAYCIQFFRQALLLNYNSKELVFYESGISNFNLEKFAPFVHGGNIGDIFNELENALYHIERNGNSKIIFTDLSIKLTRLIHKK